jgi:type II secretory pathway pseudopilin PulG
MRRPLRSGYTLLEVLLAAAIGILLLAALYVALDTQFKAAQAGRDAIEQATVARSVLQRISDDIRPSLCAIDPSRYRPSRNQGGGGSSSGAAAPAPSGGGNTAGSGNTSGGNAAAANPSGDSSANSGGTTATADLSSAVTFNLFVQGTDTALTLYVSRLPRELTLLRGQETDAGNQPLFSDLRRITWWLAGGPEAPLGLARQEIKVATSDDALGPRPPDVDDEAAHVYVEEVKSLKFSYFDGNEWLDSWDGTALGSDNRTPIGPPRAIAIVIGLAPPGRPDDTTELQYYRHVVALPTADGAAQQQSSGTGP